MGYLGLYNQLEEYSICIAPPSAGSGSSEYSSVFYGVFIAEEVDGVEENRSRNTKMVEVLILLEAFLNVFLRSACFIDEAFFWYKATLLILGPLPSIVRLSGFANYWTFILNYRNFAIYCGVKIWLQQFIAMELDADEWCHGPAILSQEKDPMSLTEGDAVGVPQLCWILCPARNQT